MFVVKLSHVCVCKNFKMYTNKKISEFINELRVMDAAAFSLCKDNNMPIVVFGLSPEGNIKKIVYGEKIGTIVTP